MVYYTLHCYILLFFAQTIRIGEAGHANDHNANKTQKVYLYRLINWCIIGKGEYMLGDWPLNQFKPILQATSRSELQTQLRNQAKIDEVLGAPSGSSVDVWGKYDLKFSPITCTELSGKAIGDNNGKFLQRVHIKFKPKNNNDKIAFQGLLIQAVHAPFGLGFPFGVFDTDQEFKCNEQCKYSNNSVILGCLSRPDISPMHPTVGIYHFKLINDEAMTVTTTTQATAQAAGGGNTGPGNAGGGPWSFPEVGYQDELHWNFKWANTACASARVVEFWVLLVIDFEKKAWTVKKFGPYNFNAFELSSQLESPVVQDPTGLAIKQPGLPLPIIPECYPFKEYPLFIHSSNERPRTCFQEFKSFDERQCKLWETAQRYPKPPATAVNVNNQNFKENKMVCDDNELSLDPNVSLTRVRFVGDFDQQCVRRYPGQKYITDTGKEKRQPHKVCSTWQERFQCVGDEENLHFDIYLLPAGDNDPNRSFPSSHCLPCDHITEEPTDPPYTGEPFFKRGEHGILMIYAFFFFNPVSLNVARFYKETLHDRQIKGWRIWLIIHVGFAAMASGLAYIGYTFPTFSEMTAHILLGYGALIGVCSGIVSGWVRHKNELIRKIMLYIHNLSGYMGWAFAIASMVFAPSISQLTRYVSYGASGICLGAMAIMTIHICSVDASIGMRPRRSHIPIIEIRFDDIVPPKSLFRKVFLYIYIAMQFIICFGMLVL